MNEAETRAEHVDPALKAAGWGVVEGSRILREYPITLGRIEGHGRRGIPLTDDYVLVYRNHKLAVIEAKAWGSNWRDILDYFAPAVQPGPHPLELRALCSAPDTRAKLLRSMAEKGFGGEQMAEMQKVIDAEKSDLFDVLAHIAYALPPLTREERANNAKDVISTHFNSKQQVFLDFVLFQYVKVGVQELDQDKLSPLLKLKYNNAIADLGRPEEIGRVFAGFQKHLYESAA